MISKIERGREEMDFENEGRLLNGIEVARILNISKALAYRMMQKGEIRVVRFGKSVRVSESDLRTFIENHKLTQK
jgi:excisionase family DNA binding protein